MLRALLWEFRVTRPLTRNFVAWSAELPRVCLPLPRVFVPAHVPWHAPVRVAPGAAPSVAGAGTLVIERLRRLGFRPAGRPVLAVLALLVVLVGLAILIVIPRLPVGIWPLVLALLTVLAVLLVVAIVAVLLGLLILRVLRLPAVPIAPRSTIFAGIAAVFRSIRPLRSGSSTGRPSRHDRIPPHSSSPAGKPPFRMREP